MALGHIHDILKLGYRWTGRPQARVSIWSEGTGARKNWSEDYSVHSMVPISCSLDWDVKQNVETRGRVADTWAGRLCPTGYLSVYRMEWACPTRESIGAGRRWRVSRNYMFFYILWSPWKWEMLLVKPVLVFWNIWSAIWMTKWDGFVNPLSS